MWITPAYAQAASGGGLGGLGGLSEYIQFFPIVAVIAIMYMLMIRPQQKRVKQHQEMVKNLRKGDSVVTSGGTVGRVTKLVDDEQIEIEIAPGVKVRQLRSMVNEVRTKGEPVGSDAAAS
jgi:preprotein translocase subunit YajC